MWGTPKHGGINHAFLWYKSHRLESRSCCCGFSMLLIKAGKSRPIFVSIDSHLFRKEGEEKKEVLESASSFLLQGSFKHILYVIPI